MLKDPEIAGFDVTMLVNQPHYVVGEAIADFYGDAGVTTSTLLYFSGHGVKDDEGRLHLAMTNTRREALMFTAISAAQLNEAMDASPSRRKVLILDCCYSGAFPAGRSAKSDEGVHTLERFQGKGRAVLTASDATQYAFEGDDLSGGGSSSVFTRYLVEAIRSGAADLDEDGDIALDELYSYVRDRVVAEAPQQRPKKQEDVDGRILIARNVHWTLPAHLRYAVESPIAAQRLSAVDGLVHLHDVATTSSAPRWTTACRTGARRQPVGVAAAARAREQLGLGRPVPPVHPAEERRPAPRRPAPVPAPPVPAPPAPSPPAPAPAPVAPRPSRGRAGPAVLLATLVAAGALLAASRFVVFESTYGYHAVSLGWSTPTWVVQVLLPVVLAVGALLAGRNLPWGVALAGGVTAGVLLSLIAQLLMSLVGHAGHQCRLRPRPRVVADPGGCAAARGGGRRRRRVLAPGTRAPLRRNRRSAAGALLVVVSAAAWLVTGPPTTHFGWWLYIRFAGPPLCRRRACPAGRAGTERGAAGVRPGRGDHQRRHGWSPSRWRACSSVCVGATQPVAGGHGSPWRRLLAVEGAWFGRAR